MTLLEAFKWALGIVLAASSLVLALSLLAEVILWQERIPPALQIPLVLAEVVALITLLLYLIT